MVCMATLLVCIWITFVHVCVVVPSLVDINQMKHHLKCIGQNFKYICLLKMNIYFCILGSSKIPVGNRHIHLPAQSVMGVLRSNKHLQKQKNPPTASCNENLELYANKWMKAFKNPWRWYIVFKQLFCLLLYLYSYLSCIHSCSACE